MTFALAFGQFAADLSPDLIPLEVDAEARRCLLDTVGVALAGTRHPTFIAARDVALTHLGGGCAQVLDGTDAAPAAAALLNGTAAHVWDFDDTSYSGIVHASAVVLPAVLAVAARHNLTDQELRTAFIAGFETVCALGHALTNATYFDGWWTTGLFGAVGAAAGAARAARLDARGCATAIAHAALLASGSRAVLGTAAKPLGCGHAARMGVEAAGYAAAGLEAPFDAIEHPFGFARPRGRMPQSVRPPTTGGEWCILRPGVARKLFPACSAMQAAGEALRDLIVAHGLKPSELVAVECGAPRLVIECLIHHRPETASQAQFSLPATLACIALHGDFTIDHLATRAWMSPEAQRLMECIKLVPEPDAFDKDSAPEGAVLRVTVEGGRRLHMFNPVATGMPARPMREADLLSKFVSCAAPVLGMSAAQALCVRILEGDGMIASLLPPS